MLSVAHCIQGLSQANVQWQCNIKTKLFVVACLTTKDCWVFLPYSIVNWGERDIPLIYLKEAQWRTVQGNNGYFVNIPIRPSQYYPVEFNHNYVCWTEITWNAPEALWNIVQPTGPDYWCDIFEDEVQTAGQVGPIDRQPIAQPRTLAPSTASEGEEEDADKRTKGTEETGAAGNTTKEDWLVELAESIHIHPPMATRTEAVREETGEINPQTGHWVRQTVNIVDDKAAFHRATGPNQGDPPSGEARRLPELLPIRMAQDNPPGGGYPRGGCPGGGYPRGGPPRGGPPGGIWGPPPGPAIAPIAHNGKLVGEAPTIYDSNRNNTQLFINQWDLYWGVNNNNTLMMNPYWQAMLFLTYIKGTNVNKYVVAVNRWLSCQLQGRILDTNKRLWNKVMASFS